MTNYELTQTSTGNGGGIVSQKYTLAYHLSAALGLFVLLVVVTFVTAFNRAVYLIYADPTPIPAATAEALRAQCEAWNERVVSSHWEWDDRGGLCVVVDELAAGAE